MFYRILSGVLCFLAYRDGRRYSLTLVELSVAAVLLFLSSLTEKIGVLNRFAGGAFGLLLLLVCIGSREQFGKGDALVLFFCGISAGAHIIVPVTVLAFLFAGAAGIVLLTFKKAGRKSRLPFLPFVALAELLLFFGTGGFL